MNFEDGEYLEGYRSLFTTTGKINRDEGIGFTRREYSNGYSLIGFEPIKEGSIRITLEFAKALPNTITVLVYAEFDNVIKVNKVQNILKDY